MEKKMRFGLNDLVFIPAICILCFIEGSFARSRGAPLSTCFTRYPKHKHSATQSGPSPYNITFEPDTYKPGEVIVVTLSGSKDKPFRGFMMAGFRDTCDSMEIVGEYIKYDVPANKSKAFACGEGARNMITHRNPQTIDENQVKFHWKAPRYNVGDIKFLATVVLDFVTFWVDIEAFLPINPTVMGLPESPEYLPLCPQGTITEGLHFSGCGDKKACFLYPRHCQAGDTHDSACVAAVSFLYREATNDYQVEMFVEPGSGPIGYIGVAFSEDAIMRDDETFVCAAFDSSIMSVQHGFNPARYNERIVSRYLSDVEVKQEEGRLECRFVMKSNTSVYRTDPSTAFSEKPKRRLVHFDKSNSWRIQLAWGPVMPDSAVITRHIDMPATTTSRVVIKEPGIYRGTAYPVLIQIHAAMMIIAWTFLSGIATVVARHYKEMMPRKRLLGTKIWFQVHRALALLVAILTGIGLIVIFVEYEWKIRKHAVPHAYWGLAVAVGLGLQIVAGLLRPGPDHKLRIFFNWGHRLLGLALQVIAAVSMFKAFEIKHVTPKMQDFGFTSLGIWVGVQVMWYICFEIVSCIMKRDKSDSYQVDNSSDEKQSWIPTVLMVIYVLFPAACCISVLLSFLLY